MERRAGGTRAAVALLALALAGLGPVAARAAAGAAASGDAPAATRADATVITPRGPKASHRADRVVAARAAGLGPVAATRAAAAGTGDTLVIKVRPVGQGDGILFRGPCGQVGLIDAPTGGAGPILSQLRAWGVDRLRWISPSHYDADHLGGVDDVIRSVDVGTVYDRGGGRNAKDTVTYRTYYDLVRARGIRQPVRIGDVFTLCSGDKKVRFIVRSVGTDGTAVGGVPVSEENDRGLCLHVRYRDFDMATCGDANGSDEGSRANVEGAVAPRFGDVDVAKVNHHGSRYSSNATYVDTLAAQVALLSVGKNPYGHPTREAVNRWKRAGARLFQTQGGTTGAAVHGTITITTDGTGSFRTRTSSGASLNAVLDEVPPPGDGSTVLSMYADPGIIKFGEGTLLRGVLRSGGTVLAGETIKVDRRPITGGAWETFATRTTTVTGSYNVNVGPSAGTEYRARFLGGGGHLADTGPVRSVKVKVAPTFGLSNGTIALGDRVRWTGRIRPAHAGETVRLQRRSGGTWKTVDSTTSGDDGRFRAWWKPGTTGTHKLRVLVPKPDADHLAGASVRRSLAVGPTVGGGGDGGGEKCDDAYPDVCIPPPPPDLNCGDISFRDFRVVEYPDPHRFDADGDGRGCES